MYNDRKNFYDSTKRLYHHKCNFILKFYIVGVLCVSVLKKNTFYTNCILIALISFYSAHNKGVKRRNNLLCILILF